MGTSALNRDIAITGMAALFPCAPDLSHYWKNIVNGVDAITTVPAGRWLRGANSLNDTSLDLPRCRRGGFIPETSIDPVLYGIAPSDLDYIEPDQLIALKLATDALIDAGQPQRRVDRERIGVILGRGGYITPGLARYEQKVRGSQQLVNAIRGLNPSIPDSAMQEVRDAFINQLGFTAHGSVIGLVPNLAASRIANRLDLLGPAYTVDGACASSLLAIDQAIRLLRENACDIVLAGGIHHCHDLSFWKVFEELGALSQSQCIRPFDENADGLLIAEGSGIIVLRRACDAARDGDRIYSIIKGTGISSDGKGSSLMSPQTSGQLRAIRAAWADAQLDPSAPGSIDLIEAHGTATPAGDQAELTTLGTIFTATPDSHAVLGSVKSMIGHAMPAAGIAAVIKTALALYHGTFPPSLHCATPNRLLARSRFRVLAKQTPWLTPPHRTCRRAGVNAFGFGGINGHLVMESFDSAGTRRSDANRDTPTALPDILTFQAESKDALVLMLQRALSSESDPCAAGGPVRLAVRNPTSDRIRQAIATVLDGKACRGQQDIWYLPDIDLDTEGTNKIALFFPGLDAHMPSISEDVAAHFRLGVPDKRGVLIHDVASHARLVIETGLFFHAVLRRLGIQVNAMAGHSIGELTAYGAAGGLPDLSKAHLSSGIDDFNFPQLPYLAVSMRSSAVIELLDRKPWSGHLVVSHQNAAEQTIICGQPDMVERFSETVRELGYFAQTLPFLSGLHTPMFGPYVETFVANIGGGQLHSASCDVWSATTSSPYPVEPDDVTALMRRHLVEPVRFHTLIRSMYDAGFRTFIQAGSGQIEALINDTLRHEPHMATSMASSRRPGMDQLQRMLLDLWSCGVAVDPHLLSHRPTLPSDYLLDLGSGLVSLPANSRTLNAGALNSELTSNPCSPAAEAFANMLERARSDLSRVIQAADDMHRPRTQPPGPAFHVSMNTMPFLRDHSLVRQGEQCDNDADRWPIVPGTMLIEIMRQYAAAARDDAKIIAIENILFSRWMEAIPSIDIPVDVRHTSPDGVVVKIGTYCQATFRFGHTYKHAQPQQSPVHQYPCEIDASQIYTERWMFHGPSYQGIQQLVHGGPDHLFARIRALPLIGATLDNLGQLVGLLGMLRLDERSLLFPHRIARIDFHSDMPKAGDLIDCLVHSFTIESLSVHACIRAAVGDTPWLTITQWSDRRFGLDSKLQSSTYFPERYPVGTSTDESWVWLSENWTDAASRELLLHYQLAQSEREEYLRLKSVRQRQWILGRIAAKDAVRCHLWESGESDVYPAEIIIRNDQKGAPYAIGNYGRNLPKLHLSIAHVEGFAVAICREESLSPGGLGIDTELLRPVDPGALKICLSREEIDLLNRSARTTSERDLLFWRLWTAKEAVSKLNGQGLNYRPLDITVISIDEFTLTMSRRADDGRTLHHAVEYRLISPTETSDKAFVVSWSIGD